MNRLCPLCAKDNSYQPESSFSKDKWIIKKCANCEFVYLENPVMYKDLVIDFAYSKTQKIVEKNRIRKNPLQKKISAHYSYFRKNIIKRDKLIYLIKRYKPEGKLLDIGCGTGGVFERLPEKISPYGIEIDEKTAYLSDKIARKYGGKVFHNDAISGLDNIDTNTFDIILMSAFLEHELNPGTLLEKSFNALKSGGILIIKVPNLSSFNRIIKKTDWCGFRYPDHVNYFNPRTLSQMVINSGFRVEKFNFLDKLAISDNMWMVCVK